MSAELRGLAPLLQVFDMQKSLAFYCGALGFAVVQKAGPPEDIGWVLLRFQHIELMLNTAYEMRDRPPQPDPARVAAHQDTALYFGCPDVEGMARRLRDEGVKAGEPKIAPYGMKQLYLSDPDGYVVCFQWPAQAAASS